MVMGGISSEREISLQTGETFFQACEELGLDARKHDFTDVVGLVNYINEDRPDVIINALHGRYGEDGNVQGVFNLLKVPYTYSGLLASAIGMCKPVAKRVVETHGITVPNGYVSRVDDLLRNPGVSCPFVVKPICEGSSVGVHIVFSYEELQVAVKRDYSLNDWVLIEEYIKGRECGVVVAFGKALAVTEIRPKELFYDYEAKYGTAKAAEHILPAPFPKEVYERALETSELIYNAINARGCLRIDYIYNEVDGKLYFLEINTQPGATSMSHLPEQARYAGISFNELVRKMIDSAEYE